MCLFTFVHIFIESTRKLVNKKHISTYICMMYLMYTTNLPHCLSYLNMYAVAVCFVSTTQSLRKPKFGNEMRNSPFYLFRQPNKLFTHGCALAFQLIQYCHVFFIHSIGNISFGNNHVTLERTLSLKIKIHFFSRSFSSSVSIFFSSFKFISFRFGFE